MKIKAKYSGKCKLCGLGFLAGEEIFWTQKDGSQHVKCSSKGSLSDYVQLANEIFRDNVKKTNRGGKKCRA